MTIGIDGNEANVQHQVGVSVYTQNLLRYFQQHATKDTQFIVYVRNEPLPSLPAENEFYKYKVVKGRFLWSQLFLPLELNLHKKIDVFFTPAHYAPRYCPVPLVVTIHDVSYFYYPQEFLKKDLYKLENWTKYSVEKAKKVIAVSKTTKKDVVKLYNQPDEKVSVVYNGFEKHIENAQSDENPLEKFNIESQKYILYVGTLQPRKNVTLLIQTFEQFVKKYPDHKLVLVGKKGWLYEQIFAAVTKKGLEKNVIFTGFIPDSDVTELYKHALCFVMPSLYEGFGIPILEAMSYDCPVIASFASSLPEIGGDGCLFFDPHSSKDLLDDLINLKENENLRNEIVNKGKERIKQFSWTKCAQETLEIIKKTT